VLKFIIKFRPSKPQTDDIALTWAQLLGEEPWPNSATTSEMVRLLPLVTSTSPFTECRPPPSVDRPPAVDLVLPLLPPQKPPGGASEEEKQRFELAKVEWRRQQKRRQEATRGDRDRPGRDHAGEAKRRESEAKARDTNRRRNRVSSHRQSARDKGEPELAGTDANGNCKCPPSCFCDICSTAVEGSESDASKAARELEDLFHASTNVFMDMDHSPAVLDQLLNDYVRVSKPGRARC